MAISFRFILFSIYKLECKTVVYCKTVLKDTGLYLIFYMAKNQSHTHLVVGDRESFVVVFKLCVHLSGKKEDEWSGGAVVLNCQQMAQ